MNLQAVKGISALIVLAAVALTIAWYRHDAHAARAALAEAQVAYGMLAAKVEEQNHAVSSLEQAGAAAREQGRRALADAERAAAGLAGHVSSLQRALAAPVEPSACPAGDGVAVVRADLAGRVPVATGAADRPGAGPDPLR